MSDQQELVTLWYLCGSRFFGIRVTVRVTAALMGACVLTVLLLYYYCYYYYYYLPSVSIPEGGLKIDENKLKGYDTQSVQSGTGSTAQQH